MTNPKTLTFYLPSPMREDAESGDVNIVNKIANAVASRGFTSSIKGDSEIELLNSVEDSGYAIFLMEEPFHPRALTLRRAYYYPFWRIESSAKRWEWEIAKTVFEPDQISYDEAARFIEYWRNRLVGIHKISVKGDKFVHVPLQGRLLECRSFQSTSPIEMLETTLRHEPDNIVQATLHPKENYSDGELAALVGLKDKYTNLKLSTSGDDQMLEGCKYIVTQNSSIALDGFFYEIPAVLFGKIDFHHIAANVDELGIEGAFSKVRKMRPQYSKYLYWFFQKMSVNAGRPDAEEQIIETFRRRGWRL